MQDHKKFFKQRLLEKVDAINGTQSSTLAAEFLDDREGLQAAGKTLLVIEDDPKFASILYDLAREQGYQCLLASTAKEGIELAQRFPLSGILLDVVLPDQTGISVLHVLKHSPLTRHIPVHVISAQDDLHPLLEKGALEY